MTTLGYTIVFVSDMTRSVAFYRDLVGLPLKHQSPDWSELGTEGCILALRKSGAALLVRTQAHGGRI